jgi:predicted RNase H-like nuclease
MTGGLPCERGKKSAAGRAERVRRLRGAGFADPISLIATGRGHGARPDDVLDALAAAWAARRIWEGAARVVPATPPVDARGLRMEIVA